MEQSRELDSFSISCFCVYIFFKGREKPGVVALTSSLIRLGRQKQKDHNFNATLDHTAGPHETSSLNK